MKKGKYRVGRIQQTKKALADGALERAAEITGDIPRAYALIPAQTQGGILAWHLLKFRVEGGRVIIIDKSEQDLRAVLLQRIEDDILRDA